MYLFLYAKQIARIENEIRFVKNEIYFLAFSLPHSFTRLPLSLSAKCVSLDIAADMCVSCETTNGPNKFRKTNKYTTNLVHWMWQIKAQLNKLHRA